MITATFDASRGIRRIVKISGALSQNISAATKDAVKLVRRSAEDRMMPARRLNVQDSSSARTLSGRRPIQVRYFDNDRRAEVVAKPYQTKARSRALVSVYSRIGAAKDLERKGLWIDPSSYLRGPRGRFAGRRKMAYGLRQRQGLRFFRFSRHPKLREWAHLPGRGYQIQKHAVKILGDAIRILTMRPALEKNRDTIRGLYAAAVAKGVAAGAL